MTARRHSRLDLGARAKVEPKKKPLKSRRPAKANKSVKFNAVLRVKLVGGALALGLMSLFSRAYHLQILGGAQWDDAARRQAVTSSTIQAKRGGIRDRNGAEMAISVDVDSIYAEPRRVPDAKDAAAKLAPVLGLDRHKLEEQLGSDRAFVYLRRKVSPEAARAVRELAIPGVGAQAEAQRFFPNRELAAHVVGFTDLEGHGQAGVEKRFEPTLEGKSYEVPGLRDALGRAVWSEGYVPQAILEGDDVILTIDSSIQRAAEVELELAVKDQDATAGIAIVMDPKQGDILAMASWPSFNPNNLAGVGPNEQLNRAVSAVFEPGSTLKMVTIAAGLEEDKIAPETAIDCENGKWRVANRTIHDTHKYGLLSVGEVMKVSSNICSAKMGFMLGAPLLHSYLEKFGFGQPTGIELPGEVGGLLRSADRWREIELANVAFGQGLNVTPLQILRAASIIANGGMRVEPRVVLGTADKTGEMTEGTRPEPVRVLSAETAAQVRDMMAEVTTKGGTAESAAIPGFAVAGKTGTAQKIDPVTKAYSRSLYVASFVGFVPADRPEAVVLVMIDEPKKAIYGGVVAAPAWKAIATAALAARNIFPSDPAAQAEFLATAALPKGLPKSLSPAAAKVLGETEVVAVEVEAAAPMIEGSRKMPDFAGLPLREVLNRSAEVHCDLVLRGTGRVVKQTPRAGEGLDTGQRCELELSPRG